MKIKSNSILDVDLDGKILVMKQSILLKQYQTLSNRLYKATGGFGCSPNGMGRTVYATCLSDGERAIWHRGDFEGWLTEEEFDKLIQKELSMTSEQFLMWQKLQNLQNEQI